MFVLVVVTQVLSGVCMLFAYGIYNNYRYERSSELVESTAITIRFDESVRYKDIKDVMNKVPKETLGESKGIMISTKYLINDSNNISEPLVDEQNEWKDEGGRIEYQVSDDEITSLLISMEYDKESGKYIYNRDDFTVYSENTLEGQFMSPEDYASGKKQLAYCYGGGIFAPEIGSKVLFCGEEYEVTARYRTLHDHVPNRIDVGFYSAPDDMRVYSLSYYFDGFVPKKRFEEVSELFYDRFGDSAEIQKPDDLELDDHAYYTTIMAIAVMFVVIPAINMAIILYYILELRNRISSVYRIEGGTRSMVISVYLAEFLPLSAICFIVGETIFGLVLFPYFSREFSYFSMIYSIWVYVVIFIVMILVVLAVLFLMLRIAVLRSPIQQIRRAKI